MCRRVLRVVRVGVLSHMETRGVGRFMAAFDRSVGLFCGFLAMAMGFPSIEVLVSSLIGHLLRRWWVVSFGAARPSLLRPAPLWGRRASALVQASVPRSGSFCGGFGGG
jgi:hypothetical protein